MNNNIQSNQFCDQTVAINYLFLFSVTSEMYHFKKKYFASCSSSSKLKPIDDEEASTSSAASSASNRGEFPCADLNERCVSPPIRTERGRSQTIYQDSGIRRTEGASFNHSLEGPFVATSSPQKRPQLWPPPVHPHPPHPQHHHLQRPRTQSRRHCRRPRIWKHFKLFLWIDHSGWLISHLLQCDQIWQNHSDKKLKFGREPWSSG